MVAESRLFGDCKRLLDDTLKPAATFFAKADHPAYTSRVPCQVVEAANVEDAVGYPCVSPALAGRTEDLGGGCSVCHGSGELRIDNACKLTNRRAFWGEAMKKRLTTEAGEQPRGAVVYFRVSTDDQATDISNMPNQEKICRDGWKGRGEILRTFVDPGESARTADRPEFQNMIAFCEAHRQEVGYVIVENLSQFARNVQDQARAINTLLDCGVRICA